MIKKLSIAAIVIAALLLAGVIFLKRSIGPTEAASLVPADTMFFVNIPNIPRSGLRWRDTCLAKIANEPELQAFLEKPLARLNAEAGFTEASRILNALKPGNIFFATPNPSTTFKGGLVGFQYWGTKQDFDNAVARMRQELSPSAADPITETYAHSEILISHHGLYSLCTASTARWGFVSTNVEAIKFALDHITGSPAADTLADNPRYKTVLSHLLSSPDFLFFLQPEKLVDYVLEIGKSYGAQAIPTQVEELKATEAIGGTLKLDGELQRDAIFTLRPTETVPPLNHKPIEFTNPDTALYFDFYARFGFLPTLLQNASATVPLQPDLLTLVDLAAEAYGPECGVIGNWLAEQKAPRLLFVTEIRDKEKTNTCLQKLLSLFPETTITEENGIKLYNIPSISNPFISPTLAQTDTFLFVSLDSSTITQALQTSTPASTLKDSPTFSSALKTYNSDQKAFMFVDTRTVFERIYTTLQPIIIFGAAVMPNSADIIDTSKLPQTETIARHLPPIVLSQQCLPDGILIESSGPITINQAILAGAAGIFAASPKLFAH